MTAMESPTTYTSRHRKLASPNNGTCTHLTMTRLYTHSFRCVICLKTSSMGWVWRCTQDRDLMLEDDADFDDNKLDAVCDMIPKSIKPRKRGPAARASRLSFLDEISQMDLQMYTAAQLSQILTQRAHVLEVARQDSEDLVSDDKSFSSARSADITFGSYIYSSTSAPETSTKLPKRIWLPPKDSECQFKCCHYCRPSLVDRSYLSLDEVASGGISPSAATGFGFHLLKQRPVALVKHVRNIGLRPSPPQLSASDSSDDDQQTTHRPPTTILKLTLSLFDSTKASSSTPSLPRQSHRSLTSQPDVPTTRDRHNICSTTRFELALQTPLPVQSPEELALISGPPTPMEESERRGMFGSAPLDLERGVAVTEEVVELHVPDLITQF